MTLMTKAVGLCEKGYRSYQEDALYPDLEKADPSEKVWVVCDGVGGHPCGDKASQLISQEAAGFLQKGLDPKVLNHYLGKTVEQYVTQIQACRSMATTLTFLLCQENGVLAGWCGDSRIYHFRQGNILFKSHDHSLVQELVEEGSLTEEEARHDMRSNIITRAIGLQQSQIAFHHEYDVIKNDYFLLCTDGVIEAVDDSALSQIFTDDDVHAIRNTLLKECREHSSDNYTAYILQVG